MSDYLSSVLDELVPTFADEDGDWGRVVADSGAETPTTTAHLWPVDATTSSAAHPGRHGRWPARWLTHRRLVAIAVTALLAALFVTPAVGLGSRLLALIQSPPGRPEVQTPAWSPDGSRIAFLIRRDGNKEVHVVSADGSGQRRLARRGEAPAWSPDGRKIAFEGGPYGTSSVYVVNADGGGQRRLARKGSAPAWSPDGRTIAFVSDSKIYLMNADGSEHRGLTKPGTAASSLAWSPDGRKLAFLSPPRGKGCGQGCFHVIVMNADGSNVRDLTPHLGGGPGHGAADPAWSPDSRTIAYVRLASPAWSRPGTILVVKPDGSGQRRLTWVPADYSAPAWSPDGRKLAFVSDRDGNSEVYVMNANGSGRRSLTRNPAYDADPAWSPDGQKIAFASNRDGRYEVYVMNADGSGQRKLTQRGP